MKTGKPLHSVGTCRRCQVILPLAAPGRGGPARRLSELRL